ncbi:MAG: Rpn family recombination-promoting nuclease/putative transposase [Alphaproteobacteria bacterium]
MSAEIQAKKKATLPQGPLRFLDPKSDLVFKKIFGQHPDLIKSFLNSLLRLPEGRQIEEITYLTPEQAPRIPSMRNTLVDVKCKDDQGQIFVVEMQMSWSASFFKRFFFGASKAYVQQLDRGQSYHDLCPVYGLAILNDVFEPKDPDFYHHYRMTKSQTLDKILPEAVELIFCELPKFTATTWTDKKMGALWLRFLKELPYMDTIPEEFQESPELLHALELTQEASYTRAELEAYDQYLDAVRVRDTLLEDTRHESEKLGLEKGLAEGEKLGLEKGLAEGEKLGLEKGKLEIGKKLLDQGMDLETVSSITGLAPEILQK